MLPASHGFFFDAAHDHHGNSSLADLRQMPFQGLHVGTKIRYVAILLSLAPPSATRLDRLLRAPQLKAWPCCFVSAAPPRSAPSMLCAEEPQLEGFLGLSQDRGADEIEAGAWARTVPKTWDGGVESLTAQLQVG